MNESWKTRKEFQGNYLQKQWIVSSPNSILKGQANVGQYRRFLFELLVLCLSPFTSYTMYCFNFMLASKNRGKACKVCSLPECLAEECQRMAKYSHRLGYQSNVHYPMQWLNFPSPTLCLFLSMPRENKDFS